MSCKCQEKCSLCHANFRGWRHRHPEDWSQSLIDIFLKDEFGLKGGNSEVCICGACDLSIRHAFKAKDKGEPYQLRWKKSKKISLCCVPTCSSTDIKAEKHEFTWEVIYDCMGIASVDTPGDVPLCTQHYQQVYRMLNAMSDKCKSCGVLCRHATHSFVSCPIPKIVESYLLDTVAFSGSISDGDQVCWSCYKFFNQILKSDVCMLSSEDIVSELKEREKS